MAQVIAMKPRSREAARYQALVRWHGNTSTQHLVELCTAHPNFPEIEGQRQCRPQPVNGGPGRAA